MYVDPVRAIAIRHGRTALELSGTQLLEGDPPDVILSPAGDTTSCLSSVFACIVIVMRRRLRRTEQVAW
jgi:hypothetical protein